MKSSLPTLIDPEDNHTYQRHTQGRSPGLVSLLALTTSVLAPDYNENKMKQKGARMRDNAMMRDNN